MSTAAEGEPDMNRKILSLVAALALATVPLAAAPERLVVPLSDPGQPATVEVALLQGSIRVVAGKAGEVVILADAGSESWHDDDEDCESCPMIAGRASDRKRKDKQKSSDRAGLRRIPNTGFQVEAEEQDNRVEIGSNSWMQALDLEIQVPPASSLALSVTNGEEIVVVGIGGELELHNTNGDIRVEDAVGPVNANTLNGDIHVTFAGALPGTPMSFSTLNGDIDLKLPRSAKLDVRLRSDHGEIYSDFDVTLLPKAPEIERDRSKGRYRVSVVKELTGKIGGGGPELFLKTFNGDIVLRSNGD
jgi:hypothetical protein